MLRNEGHYKTRFNRTWTNIIYISSNPRMKQLMDWLSNPHWTRDTGMLTYLPLSYSTHANEDHSCPVQHCFEEFTSHKLDLRRSMVHVVIDWFIRKVERQIKTQYDIYLWSVTGQYRLLCVNSASSLTNLIEQNITCNIFPSYKTSLYENDLKMIWLYGVIWSGLVFNEML